MPVSDPKDAPIAKLTPLCAWMAVAHALGLGVAVSVAQLAGWSSETGFGALGSAVLGTLAVAVGTACGGFVLARPGQRSLARIGPSVMAASVARLLVSLLCVLLLFFATQSQPRTMFVALLSCGILTLIVETAWSISAVRHAAPTPGHAMTQGDRHGARSA